ncbi:MAG: hypothetical protein IPK66_01835 [Rhodospirillales bacterium]|nr:hypothetical protein [Rhodospirillales bacterium]
MVVLETTTDAGSYFCVEPRSERHSVGRFLRIDSGWARVRGMLGFVGAIASGLIALLISKGEGPDPYTLDY